MIITVKVNDTIFRLARWDANIFRNDLTLYVQSSDFETVKTAFENIISLDILNQGIPAATYTCFTGFDQITYLGRTFVESEGKFAETMAVTLTKANIVEEVERISRQLNPVVDPDTMTLTEVKNYYLKRADADYLDTITIGTHVELSDESKLFSMSPDAQMAIMNLYNVIISSDGEITTVPYNGVNYSVDDFMKVYLAMQQFVNANNIRLTLVKELITGATTKDEVAGYSFAMDFDSATSEKYTELYSAAIANLPHIGTTPGQGGGDGSAAIDEFMNIVYGDDDTTE